MKQIKTLLAALFVAMAGTASAQTKNYVHITLNDNSVVHYSQDDIKSMIIDTEEPEVIADYVEFTSGTNTVKVATMNLGATTVADSPATSYGNYYAWGATTTSTDYSQDNAPCYENGAYIKYTSASDATLEAADDAVAANMPGWHMPTQAEFQTLYAACGGTSPSVAPSSISSGAAYAKGIYWVTGATSPVTIGDDTYSVNGMLFVQDADTHVFFPAAGSVNGTNLYGAGNGGGYWSSSLNTGDTDYAYYLAFGSGGVDPGYDYARYVGFTVRPFKDAAPAPEADYVEFTSGTNTVKVATMNLGATTVADSPATSYGNYYAWGATETFGTVDQSTGTVTATKEGGYSPANAPYLDINTWGYTKYTSASDATLEAADDAVAANMTGWHMPTEAELQTLYAACGGSDTPTGTISADQAYPTTAGIYWVAGATSPVNIGGDTYSVNGLLFVQDTDTHVFFPAAGFVDATYLTGAGNNGYYWSSSRDESLNNVAYRLSFSSSYVRPDDTDSRNYGFTVRPFKD